MNTTGPLERLRQTAGQDARKRDWLAVAQVVADVRAAETWKADAPTWRAWMERAAAAAGLDSVNTLQRFLANRDFLADIQCLDRQTPEGAHFWRAVASGDRLNPSVVEALKRLYTRSPQDFTTVINAACERGQPLTAAKINEVRANVSPVVATRGTEAEPTAGSAEEMRLLFHFPRALRTEALARVAGAIGLFCGDQAPEVKLSSDYRFEWISPDGVAVGTDGQGVLFVDGFLVAAGMTATSRAAKKRLLSRAGFEATFFRRYWIVLAGATDLPKCEKWLFEEIRGELGLRNCGIAVLDPSVTLLGDDDWGAPLPDRRRSLAKEIWRQGDPDHLPRRGART